MKKYCDDDLTDAGVVKDRRYNGIVAGLCGGGVILLIILALLLGW